MAPPPPILPGILRRDALKILGASVAALWAGGAQSGHRMTQDLWNQWQQDWRRMEALARRRGWEVFDPLTISPPASEAEIAEAAREAGVAFPTQLREVLTHHSAAIRFGWSIPKELRPKAKTRMPKTSSMRGYVWDLANLRKYAISNFLGWKENLADQGDGEEPNTPEMWENQFPLADLINGDMLTIDVSNPDGPQPVRYFSHELEGLHGRALAPDFFSFVTVLSQLGWAGITHDDWFDFVAPEDGDKTYLSLDAEGSREWLAFLAKE
jgi:cell wall assembly regulator SMI1